MLLLKTAGSPVPSRCATVGGLKLKNCEMEGCDLAFERSIVEADITTPVVSIKNPLSGSRITVPAAGEIIRDIEEGTGIVQVKTGKSHLLSDLK